EQQFELLHRQILHAEVFRMLEHQIDKHTLNRRQEHIAAVGHAVAYELKCSLIAGKRLCGASINHSWQLIEQQYQGQPTLWRLSPGVQLACLRLVGQFTEALTRLSVLFSPVAKPKPLLLPGD